MLDYLPLIIILGGLGAMAYFLIRSGKKAAQDRSALAQEKGWTYIPHDRTIVFSISDEERNISYRLDGSLEGLTLEPRWVSIRTPIWNYLSIPASNC